MTQLTQRNIDILKIIVEEYIETWQVLWSKLLLQKYALWVSSATVRWDMAKLEELCLIYQPYNSAWRLPTSKWLRAFVDYLMKSSPDYFLQEKNIKFNKNKIKNISDVIYNITLALTKNTWEISFFLLPKKNILIYSWIWNFLEKNYNKLWSSIFCIIKILEDKLSFTKFIQEQDISKIMNILIWEENIIPFLKNYTIIFKKIIIDWNIWYIWIVWSLQMNYSFNISSVRWII